MHEVDCVSSLRLCQAVFMFCVKKQRRLNLAKTKEKSSKNQAKEEGERERAKENPATKPRK